MIVITFIEVESEASLQILVGEVETESVIKPEVHSESGFRVGPKEVSVFWSIYLFDRKSLEKSNILQFSKAIVSKVYICSSLIVKLEVSGALEHSKSTIIILRYEVQRNYLLL